MANKFQATELDKMMQAAFRMRQLDRGQKLLLLLPREVVMKIRDLNKILVGVDIDSNDVNAQHVLVWIFNNTVESTSAGLVE